MTWVRMHDIYIPRSMDVIPHTTTGHKDNQFRCLRLATSFLHYKLQSF